MILQRKIRIYLACAVHNADGEFAFRNEAAAALRGVGLEVIRFYSDLPPEERQGLNIYSFDMARVAEADLVVSILDKGSTGVGMELRCADEHGIPVILFSRNLPEVSGITHAYLESRKMPEAIGLPPEPRAAIANLVAGVLERTASLACR